MRIPSYPPQRRSAALHSLVAMDAFEDKCSQLRDPGFVNLVVSMYVSCLGEQLGCSS